MSAAAGEGTLDPAAVERLERIGGREFVLEMIRLFLEHGPERVASARAAHAAGDRDTLYRAAHSLKSTAGNLGARRLQATAEALEERARGEDLDGVESLLRELEERFERVRRALQRERDRTTGRGT